MKKKVIKVSSKIRPVISISAGAFHGYCDSQGIELGKSLELGLTYGPSILGGFVTGGLTAGILMRKKHKTRTLKILLGEKVHIQEQETR